MSFNPKNNALEWSSFKSFVDNRSASLQYFENSNNYYCFAFDGRLSINCLLVKGSSDATDFENNYKPSSNAKLWNQSFSNDGRLETEGIVTSSNGTRIGSIGDQLKTVSALAGSLSYDKMNVANGGVAIDTQISGTYTTLYLYNSGGGQFISFVCQLEKAETENWEVNLLADGVSVFTITTVEFKNTYKLADDAFAQIIGVSVVGDSFRFKVPNNQVVNFNSSVEIQARCLTSSKKFRGGITALLKS